MKTRAFVLVVALTSLTMAPPSLAQDKQGTGLGIILGNPTGISFKTWVGPDKAIDAAAAWSFSNSGYVQVHADLLFHNFEWIEPRWPVYYGVGAVVGLGDDLRLGARIPVGIAHNFQSAPFDVFVEVVPRLDLLPGTDFEIDAAIGGRYYFGRAM